MPIQKKQCKRCGHVWIPNKEKPVVCPNCHSPYWNIEKEVKKYEG